MGEDHLVPETGFLAKYDRYQAKLSELFAVAQKGEPVCQAVIIASFFPEALVGIRKNGDGYEAFGIYPKSAVWDTELVQMHEDGQITSYDKDGKELSLEQNESFQALKKRTPADFRKIETVVKAVAIAGPLARRISAVWERMLLQTRYPKEIQLTLDGAAYHFSMPIEKLGIISGEIAGPIRPKSKTAGLMDLAMNLSLFVNDHADLKVLTKSVTQAEKLMKD
jgi:hypothetical protein